VNPTRENKTITLTAEEELTAVRAGRDRLVQLNQELMEQQVRRFHQPSTLLAAAAWLSTFALIWLLVLRIVDGGFLTGVVLMFFMLVALAASGQK